MNELEPSWAKGYPGGNLESSGRNSRLTHNRLYPGRRAAATWHTCTRRSRSLPARGSGRIRADEEGCTGRLVFRLEELEDHDDDQADWWKAEEE
jgi:hypothetical protein